MPETVKHNVSTKLVFLDLKTILENYRNPKFWEKEWLIFKNKELEVRWSITKINVMSNSIISNIVFNRGSVVRGGKRFSIDYTYCHKSDWDWTTNVCRPIPINNSDYTQDTFMRNILSTILNTLKNIELEMTRNTYEYQKARELEDEQEEKLKEIAEAFLDENNVSNDSIREAYIEKFVEKNKSTKLTEKILANSQFRFFKTAYLHICSWFDNMALFEEYKKKLSNRVSEKAIFEVFEETKKMKSDEWVEQMKDQLPSL